MLLVTLLVDVTTSEDTFHKVCALSAAMNDLLSHGQYATTCTALLSAPLKVPEPAILPTFITKLLDNAVRSPSTDSIRLIYHLFCGLTFEYVDKLPIDLLVRLQDQLIKTLSVPEADDYSANLICLAILAKLKSVESTIPVAWDRSSVLEGRSSPLDANPSNSESAPKPLDRYSSARQFFTAKRSAKTLDLVTLKGFSP